MNVQFISIAITDDAVYIPINPLNYSDLLPKFVADLLEDFEITGHLYMNFYNYLSYPERAKQEYLIIENDKSIWHGNYSDLISLLSELYRTFKG